MCVCLCVCADIDECDYNETSMTCGDNQACLNTDGSYICVCQSGYQLVGNECQGNHNNN